MIFPIGELSRQTGIKLPTIRHYEARGLIAPPRRSAGNQRRLRALEAEPERITEGCTGEGPSRECSVLASLGDHAMCDHDHAPTDR